jgi:HJR/Mrr/RecB family endonuclease
MSSDIFDLEAAEARVAMLDEQINSQQRVVAPQAVRFRGTSNPTHKSQDRHSRLRAKRAAVSTDARLDLIRGSRGCSLSFVATDVVIGSLVAALVSASVAASAAGIAVAAILYLPTESRLSDALVEAEIEANIAEARAADWRTVDGLGVQEKYLKELMAERLNQLTTLRSEVAAKMRLRRSLLEQDWRAMRDYEWEEFLVRVFRALGIKAQRIGGAGDQGVDLIVEIGSRRVAVQAKGYLNAVNNSAIQQVFAGKVHHQCTDCAVITNSRFTQGAYEIAASTTCILIGADEFPDLVIGHRSLLKLEQVGRR